MEVLNAAGLTPISLHKTKRRTEPRKNSPLKTPKSSTFESHRPSFPEVLSRGFTALTAVLGVGGFAKALTYEEALQQARDISSSFGGGSSDIDVGGFFDGILKFGSENPLAIGGGAVVVAVPLILSQILGKPKARGIESAKNAYSKLSEDPDAQLLDIRDGREFKEVGSPDIRSTKKKAASIPYRGDDKPGFLKKLALKFKDPASTTLFILDKFDGNSELVAELATANGFKAAFAIRDGAEGARGWMKSGLPWSPPKKALNVDFTDLKDAITNALGEGSDGLPVTLGLAAATGLGVFVFSEIETVLQLLGSAALIQFVTKKFLFAEDRKVTLQQVDEFLNTKVSPKELADEIKMIGKALLPVTTSSMASLPAAAEGTLNTSATATPVQKTDTIPDTKAELKVEAAAEPPPTINSVPKSEVSKPLSPYPYYPDFKPPSSPSPTPS